MASLLLKSKGDRVRCQSKGVTTYADIDKKIAINQRKLSKKKKASKNRLKQILKITKLHNKKKNIRQNFTHQASANLSKNHAMIVVEALKVKNMSKSAKGTIEAPGNNVKAKSGLNRAILNQGWGEFRRQLKYKLEWQGGIYLEVNAMYTSQKCSKCNKR